MYTLPSHSFQEVQALLRQSGSATESHSLIEFRGGRTDFRSLDGHVTQRSRGMDPNPEILNQIYELQAKLKELMEPYSPYLKNGRSHALVRKRWSLSPEESQMFSSFWGTLELENAWDVVFGAMNQGKISFRRGPWEEWPMDLPSFSRFQKKYPVVFSPYCSTLLHEAVGHGLEAEYLLTSPLKPKIGFPFCHNELTISDNPELPGLAGSQTFDDAGQPASETLLIHRGCFVGDLDREKGVWRRGSFKELPYIRTSNMVVHKGSSDPADWFRFLDDFYYVSWISKGRWLPGTQEIQVETGPVFRIHKGEPTAFYNQIKLNFYSLEFLKSIQAVGGDVRLDPLVHWCVKHDQGVPISLVSPSLLVDNCFHIASKGAPHG